MLISQAVSSPPTPIPPHTHTTALLSGLNLETLAPQASVCCHTGGTIPSISSLFSSVIKHFIREADGPDVPYLLCCVSKNLAQGGGALLLTTLLLQLD